MSDVDEALRVYVTWQGTYMHLYQKSNGIGSLQALCALNEVTSTIIKYWHLKVLAAGSTSHA